jgi:hypothetical protein
MDGVGKGTLEAFDDDTCSHVDDSLVDRRPFPSHATALSKSAPRDGKTRGCLCG